MYDVIIVTISKPANEPCKDNKVNPSGDPGYINKNFTLTKQTMGRFRQFASRKAPGPIAQNRREPLVFHSNSDDRIA